MTTSIAARSNGSRKLDITRSESRPKMATSARRTPKETSRATRFGGVSVGIWLLRSIPRRGANRGSMGQG